MSPQFPDDFDLADYFLFRRIVEGLGDKTALRFGERAYSYSDVAARARAVGNYLVQSGVAQEQRVYLVLPDAPPFAWSFFGTLAAGAVVAMGNPDSPVEDLAYVIDYIRPAAIITVPRVASALGDKLARATFLKRVLIVPDAPTGSDPEAPLDLSSLQSTSLANKAVALSTAIAESSYSMAPPRIRRDDQAIWLFTSGSTGRPKAAIHTHRDFAFNTEVYAKRTVGYRRDDVTVSVPRLFFGYATGTNLMFPFAVGATVGMFSERPTPESLATAISLYRPTIVTNVPTMMGKLLEYDEALSKNNRPPLDLSSIRFHLSAGEALPPPLLERFTSHFKNDVYDGIGSAEMFHIYASNRPGDIRPGSLGRVVDGYAIRILSDDAEGPGAPALPPGETGVMWVKGDSVAIGYHQDRDKSWATFHGHWCKTGDLFRLDQQGYLWFSGRADDLLKVSGQWVAPTEVEACLMAHPSVQLAAVIGADDEGLQKPKAFVVLREAERARAATAEDLARLASDIQDFVKARLSKHKYPRWIVFADDLPKNDRGKVDKRSLKAMEGKPAS